MQSHIIPDQFVFLSLCRECHLFWPICLPNVISLSLTHTHADESILTCTRLTVLVFCFHIIWICSPTFLKIRKAKSVEDFKPDPYLATVLNCAMWCFYGLPFVHPDSLLVITINGSGLIIEIIYVTFFFIYSSSSNRVSESWYHITEQYSLFKYSLFKDLRIYNSWFKM